MAVIDLCYFAAAYLHWLNVPRYHRFAYRPTECNNLQYYYFTRLKRPLEHERMMLTGHAIHRSLEQLLLVV